MNTAYSGVINTNGQWENLSTLTGITFVKDTIYSIQIQNPAWLKVGENGVPFLFNRDIPFPWKAKENTDLYIKTTRQNSVLSIDTDTGFFLNKSGGGGGSTAKNTAIIQKDNVVREVSSKVQGKVPDNFTRVGGTLTNDMIYTGAANAYILPDRVFPFNSASTWELQFKYKYAGKTQENITGDDYKNPTLWINGSKKLEIWLSSNGTSWNIGNAVSGITLSSGVTYWVKFGFDGAKYYIDYNTDGSDNYTRTATFNSSTSVYTGTSLMRIANATANNRLTTRYLTGELYLGEMKLYINGSLYWQPTIYNWQDL